MQVQQHQLTRRISGDTIYTPREKVLNTFYTYSLFILIYTLREKVKPQKLSGGKLHSLEKDKLTKIGSSVNGMCTTASKTVRIYSKSDFLWF